MGLLDILRPYDGNSPPPADVDRHFDEVAGQVPPADLGNGIAAAFRSDATPPFGDMVSNLFGKSNPQQRAGIVEQLLRAIGPGALGSVAGGVLGRVLGGSPTAAGAAPPATITPEQASRLSPADVGAIAAHAEQHDPSIVDRAASFYAQHPTLVKSLGALALSAVLGHLRTQQR